MKIENSKKLLKKVLISILTALVIFNIITPTMVKAEEEDDGIGGALFEPIQSLVVGLGDAFMKLMQFSFNGNGDVTATIKKSQNFSIYKSGAEVYNGKINDMTASNFSKKNVYIPMFQLSPESIFSGKIPAFDINFFNPQNSITVNNQYYDESNGKLIISYLMEVEWGQPVYNHGFDEYEGTNGCSYVKKNLYTILTENGWTMDNNGTWSHPNQVGDIEHSQNMLKTIDYYTYKWESKNKNSKNILYKLKYTHCTNILDGISTDWEGYEVYEIPWIEDIEVRESSAGILQSTVSYWYNALRNIAIIGLLSVLVYVGIRIVLSSTAADKSKYKEMLKDWLVAICLLFFMHYFMSFIVTVTGTVTEALVNTSNSISKENTIIRIETGDEVYTATGKNIALNTEDTTDVKYIGDQLIGDARIKLQTGDLSQRMAFTIIYIVLVIYTFVFALMYLKRVIYMAFFTMIAPLVALTYPLDKMRDGKAQAFDMWMKEYTFNALLQPFHLIIYYVLVTSAINLATSNPIYALVAIGFIMPAEKLLRKFFGLNKSETAGILGGALGGALLMQGINALKNRGKGSKGKGGASGKEASKDKQKPVRTNNAGYNTDKLTNDIRDEEDKTNVVTSDGPEDEPINEMDHRLDDGENTLSPEEMAEQDPNYMYMHPEQFGYGNQNDEQEEVNTVENAQGENEDLLNEDNELADTEDNDSKFGLKLGAAALTAGKYALKGTGKVAGLAVKATGAATLGTIGIAAGLASDDYSNVIKYGTAGLVAGKAMGSSAVNRVRRLPSDAYKIKKTATEIRNDYEQRAYTASELKEIRNRRADEAFMRDREAQKLYKAKFNEDYKKAMEEAKKYREYGITDNEAIIKAMKLKSDGLGDIADKKRILVAKHANDLGRKDIDNFGSRLEARGLSKETANSIKEAIRKYKDIE